MVDRTRRLLLITPLLAAFVWGARADTLVFENVRLFDGRALVDSATVIVRDGVIDAVGADIPIPADAERVSTAGATLLPGFIDSHGHSFGDSLERAVVWGTTTVIDMFTAPDFATARRAEQAHGDASGRADLVSAGVLATAPGGHGTQFGVDIPTLTSPEQAAGWLEGRVAEGSDFIKIVLEDGTMIGRPLPTLDPPTLAAVTAGAHDRGLLAVVHATTLPMAQLAADHGVDGFVHLFRDEVAPAAWVRQLAAAGMFVIPTLTVLESTTGNPSGASLVEDERLSPWLTAFERGGLTQSFPSRSGASLTDAQQTTAMLRDAEVAILAGTDAPNPGTAHGVSMHRELELLVRAGLTPPEALVAATAAPAHAFSLGDRGVIEVGRRADLLLVHGDPTTDITATRDILGVWKGGAAVPRPAIESPDTENRPRVAGAVANFDDGELTAQIGFGFVESTDSMMGGKSTVTVEVVEGGAGGTSHALRVAGEILPGFAFPWAGAMYFPGSAPMTPIDASGASEIAFHARGDAGTYRVMVFAESLGQMPAQQSFEVGEGWSPVALRLDAFPGFDAAGATGFLWTAGPTRGSFRLEIDQIELRSVD